MKQKTKNLISLILPLTTILIIAIMLRGQPTGLVIHQNITLYRINANITLTLEEKIPIDSHIRININNHITRINLVDFLQKSGKNYKIIKENNKNYVIGDEIYTVDFNSLGITQGFKGRKHTIRTEIVHQDSVLYSNKEIIEI